tara:strand:- start:518 stop:979 length:462 start_codon:yes stop_codon:yes gene_type:complete
MFFYFKNHFNLIVILAIILSGCQLKEPNKIHGITFLKNRSEKLEIAKSNKNDTVRVLGQPHSKSINDEDEWFYIERTLTKGEFHKLGQHVLKENNVLFLSFNKYGILEKKVFLDKNDKNKLVFLDKNTENERTKKSFVEKFLTSIKAKMYGNK